MVRPEFSYVAENLLLRGGYRKTHFQADTITFYNVSEMGNSFNGKIEHIKLNSKSFEPKIVFRREFQKIPEKFYFRELILQSLVRKKIQFSIFDQILEYFDIDNSPEEFEVLGEKALPEGFVDIFIKLKHPTGRNKYILVEIKTGKANKKDIIQLKNYLGEFGNEAVGGVLIAKDFPKHSIEDSKIIMIKYYFDQLNDINEYSYNKLFELLNFEGRV